MLKTVFCLNETTPPQNDTTDSGPLQCTVCVHSTSEAVTLIIFSSSVSITLEQLSCVF